LAAADRTLGILWHYSPCDDGRADGLRLEWRDELAWQRLHAQLYAGLSMLPERSIQARERADLAESRTLYWGHSRRFGDVQAAAALP
jgi:hypothetical protein